MTMRDIRFRGKTLKGEWIVGDLMRTNGQTGDGWAIQYEDPESGWMMEDVRVGTIGQFTGLHDKDGRDIYEGDLVEMMRTPEKMRRRVMTRHIVNSWSVCDWIFESLTKEVLGQSMANHSDFDSYRFTVVGNIHDNPDMVQEVSLTFPERKPRRNSGKVKIEFVTKDATISTHVSQETAQALVEEMSRRN